MKKTLLLLPLFLFLCSVHTALAAVPHVLSDPNARWEYQTPSRENRYKSTAEVVIQGQNASFGYDQRHAYLNFSFDFEKVVENVGEVTIDGEMLSAYAACYDEDSSACQTDYVRFRLHLDDPSIEQIRRGKQLRLTVKTRDGALFTLRIPLAGSTQAIEQVQEVLRADEVNDLMFALLHRNRSKVETLIAAGSDVNTKTRLDRTPLSIVAPDSYGEDELTEEDRDLMRFLVSKGGDINAPKADPLLVQQIDYCSPELVSFLLDLGADPNARDFVGKSALLASRSNRNFRELYPILIAAGADKQAVDKDGRNLLHLWALVEEGTETVKFLLDEGFDVNQQDALGATALMYAAISFEYKTVRLLLKRGAKIDIAMNDGSTLKQYLNSERDKFFNYGKHDKVEAYKSMLGVLEDSKYFKVNFKNKTSDDVQVAIRYKNSDGEWMTGAWFNIAPGKSSYVAKTKNAIIYYRAHAVNEDWVWSGDDNYYYVPGSDEKKGFKEKTAGDDDRGDKYWIYLSAD